MVGKFQTDFGTIYRHPGHEVYHKWGEILQKTDRPYKKNYSSFTDLNYENNSINEFSLKGFVKFDIILLSRGDKSKVI